MPIRTEPNNRQNLPVKKDASIYFTHPAQKARISMIATPIGNLSDLSERAKQALAQVDELWCEDTRHTQALLNAVGISRGNLKRVDQHIQDAELRRMLRAVESSGQWIGVVSDAGTPGVSDPGAKISEQIHEFPEIRLEAVPGASAVSAFISIAAATSGKFNFQGFFPRNETDSLQLLTSLQDHSANECSIFFESPNRILDTIATLNSWCETLDFTPKFTFAKEITKIHETIWSGHGAHFLEWLQAQAINERGEWVFSVSLPKSCVINKKAQSDWEVTLECLIFAGVSTKDAASVISGRFSVAKKLAYQSALEIQKNNKK